MKKILSKREKDRIVKRNIILISALGIFLIGIMVFSTFGFAMSGRGDDTGSNKKIKINGIELIKNFEHWIFDYQGETFQLRYSPEEVSDLNIVTNKKLQDYKDKPVYFTSDSGEPLYEFIRNIDPYTLRVAPACLEGEECVGDYPVKSCETDNIIIINEAVNQSESFYEDNNCIYITASYINQTKYVDAYLYKILGI